MIQSLGLITDIQPVRDPYSDVPVVMAQFQPMSPVKNNLSTGAAASINALMYHTNDVQSCIDSQPNGTDTNKIYTINITETADERNTNIQMPSSNIILKQHGSNVELQNDTVNTLLDDCTAVHQKVTQAINDDTNDAKTMESVESLQPSASPEPYLLEPITGIDLINASDDELPIHQTNIINDTSIANNNGSNTYVNPLHRRVELSAYEQLQLGKRKYMYRLIDKECELFWHVDAVSNKQAKQMFIGSVDHRNHFTDTNLSNRTQRRKYQLGQSLSDTDHALQSTPSSVSTGYGELAAGSMDKLFKWLVYDAPDDYRLNNKSTFLDIGSGFGKAVFHAVLRSNCSSSIGIEYVESRHEKAKQCMAYLATRWSPSLDFSCIPEQYTEIDVENCHLYQGDACDRKYNDIINQSTHIYMFDWVFPEETHEKLIPIIDESNCQIFISYQAKRIEKLQLNNYSSIHTIKCSTTGKQSFTATIYLRHSNRINTRTIRKSVSRLIDEPSVTNKYCTGSDRNNENESEISNVNDQQPSITKHLNKSSTENSHPIDAALPSVAYNKLAHKPSNTTNKTRSKSTDDQQSTAQNKRRKSSKAQSTDDVSAYNKRAHSKHVYSDAVQPILYDTKPKPRRSLNSLSFEQHIELIIQQTANDQIHTDHQQTRKSIRSNTTDQSNKQMHNDKHTKSNQSNDSVQPTVTISDIFSSLDSSVSNDTEFDLTTDDIPIDIRRYFKHNVTDVAAPTVYTHHKSRQSFNSALSADMEAELLDRTIRMIEAREKRDATLKKHLTAKQAAANQQAI